MAEVKKETSQYTQSQMQVLDSFIKEMANGTMDYENVRELFQRRLEDNGVEDVAKRMKIFDNKHLLDEKVTDLAIQAAMFDDDYILQYERKEKAKRKWERAKANGEKALEKKLKEEYKREEQLLRAAEYNKKYGTKEYYETANKDSYLNKRGLGDAEGVQRMANQACQAITKTAIFSLFCPPLAMMYGSFMAAGLGVLAIVNLFAKHKRNARNATLETYKDFVRELCRDRNLDSSMEQELVNDGKKSIDDDFDKIAPESIALQAANNERKQRNTPEESQEVAIIPEDLRDSYYRDFDILEQFAFARDEVDKKFDKTREEMKKRFYEENRKINEDDSLSADEKMQKRSNLNKSYDEALSNLNAEYNEALRKLEEKFNVENIRSRDKERTEKIKGLDYKPSGNDKSHSAEKIL